jgi:hypothetical protein
MMAMHIDWIESGKYDFYFMVILFFCMHELIYMIIFSYCLQHTEESKIEKEAETHEKRLRKELEKQDVLKRKVCLVHIIGDQLYLMVRHLTF